MEQQAGFVAQGSHLIRHVVYSGPYMTLSNHSAHGLGAFRLSSSTLELHEVMLITISFIVILPKDVSILLYMWATLS